MFLFRVLERYILVHHSLYHFNGMLSGNRWKPYLKSAESADVDNVKNFCNESIETFAIFKREFSEYQNMNAKVFLPVFFLA